MNLSDAGIEAFDELCHWHITGDEQSLDCINHLLFSVLWAVKYDLVGTQKNHISGVATKLAMYPTSTVVL
jgi:hypothetical protein